MSSTLTSKGYKLPTTGDRGTWWTDLNFNTQRVNDHTHDGSNSQLLDTSLMTKGSVSVLAANWVATAGGTYRQLVTHPTGVTFPGCCMTVYLTTLGHQIYPTIEKVSASTYYIYINDNTLDLTVKYA